RLSPSAIGPTSTSFIEAIGVDSQDLQNPDLAKLRTQDVDFFRLQPTQSGVLELDVDNHYVDIVQPIAPNLPPLDSVLQVWDSQGHRLAFNDDDLSNLDDSDPFNDADPKLFLEVKQGVDYYVSVSQYGNATFNPFEPFSGISVTEQGLPPTF